MKEGDKNFETLEIIVPKGATSHVIFAVESRSFILQLSYPPPPPPPPPFPIFYVTCRSSMSEISNIKLLLPRVEPDTFAR